LRDHGVPREEIPALAKAAIGAARLITNNPRKVLEKDVVKLLEENY
jgi:alcohol dehydrogenase class IV